MTPASAAAQSWFGVRWDPFSRTTLYRGIARLTPLVHTGRGWALSQAPTDLGPGQALGGWGLTQAVGSELALYRLEGDRPPYTAYTPETPEGETLHKFVLIPGTLDLRAVEREASLTFRVEVPQAARPMMLESQAWGRLHTLTWGGQIVIRMHAVAGPERQFTLSCTVNDRLLFTGSPVRSETLTCGWGLELACSGAYRARVTSEAEGRPLQVQLDEVYLQRALGYSPDAGELLWDEGDPRPVCEPAWRLTLNGGETNGRTTRIDIDQGVPYKLEASAATYSEPPVGTVRPNER